MKTALNLGSGDDYRPEATNVDFFSEKADLRFDLNTRPWPFENNSFSVIHCENIIEHLDNVITTMEEIHRVACNGALVHIRVPHFRSACLYEDITHKHGFAWKTFDLFTQAHTQGQYSTKRFSIEHREYTTYLLPPLYKLLSKIPVLTDNLLSKYIPMASIRFTLKVQK
jgi:SAM-dependent methyltransferase